MARPYDDPLTATFDPQVEAEAGYSDQAMREQGEAEGLANMPGLNAKNIGMGQAYAEAAAAEQRATVAEANRVYAEEQYAQRYNTDPVFRMEEDAKEKNAEEAYLLQRGGATVPVRRQNIDYGPNRDYAGTMLGTPEQPGLLDQSYQAQEGLNEAQLAASREHAQGLQRLSDEMERDNARLYGTDIVENVVGDAGEPLFNEDGTPMRRVVGRQPGLLEIRQAHEQAARDRAVKAEAAVTNAAQEMQKEYGAKGWWEKRTPAQKFGVGLALVLAGIGGGQAVNTMRQAISDYNEEEKAKFGALRESADESKSVWRELRAQSQSDNEADLMTSNAMWKAALAHNDAKLAAAGVQVLTAEQQVQRTQILAEIAENERQLRIMQAHNAARGPYSTVQVSANTPIENMWIKAKLQAYAKGDMEAGRDVVAVMRDREKRREEAAIEGAKASRASEEKRRYGEHGTARQKQWLAEKTTDLREERRQLQAFLDTYPGDIPALVYGLGWQKKLRTDEGTAAYESAKRPVFKRLRRESGAAIPDAEVMREAEASLDAMSETELRDDFKRRIAEVDAQLDSLERGVDPEAVEEFTANRDIPERAPLEAGGFGLPDPVRRR